MKKNILSIILSVLCALLSVNCLFLINNMGIIPFKYLSIIIGVFLIINILISFLLFRKNKICKVLGILLGIIIVFANGISIYYVNSTNKFLDEAFNGKIVESTTYYILAKKDNNYTEKDITGDI